VNTDAATTVIITYLLSRIRLSLSACFISVDLCVDVLAQTNYCKHIYGVCVHCIGLLLRIVSAGPIMWGQHYSQ